ncbi:MAG: DNA mismatch repair protein MutS [Alphaproteobacteria bacterium]|nr:DNA mismatch repair protein MutS [Alphaproteobacteria bacterium]
MTRKPPDFDLWTEVARGVKPLGRHRPAAKTVKPAKKVPAAAAVSAPRHEPVLPRRQPATVPSLAAFDRRMAQKLTRGKAEIEDRIDLHGTGLEEARVRLLRFLERAHHHGLGMVLVITGKGASPFSGHTLHGRSHFHAPERQGKLRRALPDWLHEAPFRLVASGFQPAHPRHGGGGAFYVKIRKRRRSP